LDPRLSQATRLYFFFIFGAFLLVSPWSLIWDHMVVSLSPSGGAGVLRSGWVRGGVSGLGLLDLLLAVRQATRLMTGNREV
jgi:hypothetical protein